MAEESGSIPGQGAERRSTSSSAREELERFEQKPVLIVEDSEEDFIAIRRGFRDAKIVNPIRHCGDGEAAMRYLNEAYSADEDLPCLIIVDLNLPGRDGRSVLAEIKQDDRFRRVPAIVLTSSENERDVENSFASGANSYLSKPNGYAQIKELANTLLKFWLARPQLDRK